jgi:Glycoside-hydrolase family GH114
MTNRLDLARTKNCDGVEPDNVDGYTNDSGFPLTGADQLAYNRFLATEAHARDLSIGLKNDLDQVTELVDHFDWALNEQCVQYDECSLLSPFVAANKAVFGVEYIEEERKTGPPATFCPQVNALDFDWLQKDYDLGATPYVYCRDVGTSGTTGTTASSSSSSSSTGTGGSTSASSSTTSSSSTTGAAAAASSLSLSLSALFVVLLSCAFLL